MRALVILFAILTVSFDAAAADSGKVIKVLPQYLDLQGRHSISPSLYDRDAYQAHLRKTPHDRSGLRFAIQWRAPSASPLKLRVELRGARGKELTRAFLETTVKHGGFFSKWTELALTGDEFKNFGDLAAWRATLWQGGTVLSEQKSFLW